MCNVLRVCAFLAGFSVAPALAQVYTAGQIRIEIAGAGGVGGAYLMTLRVVDNGNEPDRLLGGSSPASTHFQIQELSSANGVGRGLEIHPGKPLLVHVKFVVSEEGLKEVDQIPATLEFAKAGRVQVNFPVKRTGAKHGGTKAQPTPRTSR